MFSSEKNRESKSLLEERTVALKRGNENLKCGRRIQTEVHGNTKKLFQIRGEGEARKNN